MTKAWTVGPVNLLPKEEALRDVDYSASSSPLVKLFTDPLEKLGAETFGQVDAQDLDAGINLVAQAIDLLRVFQHVRCGMIKPTLFGLPTEIGHAVVPYIVATTGTQARLGFTHKGERLGWTFSDDDAWQGAQVYHWIGRAIGQPDATESQRRSLIAVQSLSKAIVDPRSTMKMVQVVIALEALLLDDAWTGQTFKLARTSPILDVGARKATSAGGRRITARILRLTPRLIRTHEPA